MESTRLIIAPQLPVKMRYQEWWGGELRKNLRPYFKDIIILGQQASEEISNPGEFSIIQRAIKNELFQMRQFLKLKLSPQDILLHCDLSFPGIFHSVLFHTRKIRTVAFCHATSLNRYDVFRKIRDKKWPFERTTAKLYDSILVATQYHKDKLGLPNVSVLGALPNPPGPILPHPSKRPRDIMFTSVTRPCCQKIDISVEKELQRVTGIKIRRHKFYSWERYYQFLDRVRFLIITAKEETYGYQVVDSFLRGCIPIAPRAFSYPELLPPELLYNPKASVEEKVKQIIQIADKIKTKDKKYTIQNSKAIAQFYPNLTRQLKGE